MQRVTFDGGDGVVDNMFLSCLMTVWRLSSFASCQWHAFSTSHHIPCDVSSSHQSHSFSRVCTRPAAGIISFFIQRSRLHLKISHVHSIHFDTFSHLSTAPPSTSRYDRTSSPTLASPGSHNSFVRTLSEKKLSMQVSSVLSVRLCAHV